MLCSVFNVYVVRHSASLMITDMYFCTIC